ncbi:MAG: SH3 domain-containing protein [Polyangiaceae bacterium]
MTRFWSAVVLPVAFASMLGTFGCSASRGADDGAVAESAALTGTASAGSGAVTTGAVRLRTGPSVSASIVRLLPSGTSVTLVDGAPDGGFYRVRTDDGTEGFCFGGFLALTEAAAAAAGGQIGEATGETYHAHGTGYYPDNSALEGGFRDRQGAPLHTLQDYLAGNAPYVSVAMDKNAFPYGQKLRIPELEAAHGGQPIEFRVVDTGGAFTGKGHSRIDICTANHAASLDPVVNGPLTLVVVD